MSLYELDTIIEERVEDLKLSLKEAANYESSSAYSPKAVKSKLKLVAEEIDSLLAEFHKDLGVEMLLALRSLLVELDKRI